MIDRLFGFRDSLQGSAYAVVPTLARLVFASVLFLFFWRSALTKFDGIFSLSAGAYVQIFPKTMEAVGYDPSQLGVIYRLIAFAGSYSELILPILLVVGLFTRLAALGMIGFVIVLSIVDVTAYEAATGAFFDGDPKGLIFDQRLMWIAFLVVNVFMGAGPLSLDRLIFRARPA